MSATPNPAGPASEAGASGPGSRTDLALVLSGGGARAAYQAGVVDVLAQAFPGIRPSILTGVSAGAINAACLAARPESWPVRVRLLRRTWEELLTEEVFRVGSLGLFENVLWAGLRLVSGGRLRRGRHGMVDTSPLRSFLFDVLQASPDGRLPGIRARLEAGELDSIAITASSYTTNQSITWVQGHAIEGWERPGRRSRRAELRVDHVMASAALPLLFPSVLVDGAWYGDGGIRLTAPLSPAVHLGAERILAISTRHVRTHSEEERPEVDGYPPPAQVAGMLLNAIFLDQFDGDALRLQRINDLLQHLPPQKAAGFRRIELLVMRPSQDLGRMANEHEPALPRTFRFLTRGLGTQETRSNDFLSLVMFQPDYLRRLIELGRADATARLDEIGAFLGNEAPARDLPAAL